nr:hypothetical protein [Tanacetum cinerariifolium]
MQKRRNDVKARTTLLLALPDEHQLRFRKYETIKELWEAILNTFGGNEATKKTKKNQLKLQYGNFKAEGSETLEQTFNRLQDIVSHLEFIDVEIEQDDLYQKFLTSLAPEWLMYTIVWRNKDDLDTMSLDDVYNHLKVYEPEVQKKSESNSQNMAFISSSNTSSGKGKVHTASVPTASTQVSIANTDIDEDDIEEMDIKWNIALLSMRADRFWKKTGKKITIQGSDVAGFDKSKVECFNCHKMGYFARECRAPRSQDRGKRESYKQGPKKEEPAPKALMAIDGIGWDWSYMANEEENHALVADEVPTEFALMDKLSSSSDNEGNPYNNIDDKGYWDSGCSRHMTRNISYLSEYEPYDGGYVSFGHGGGKITSKGIIKIDFKLTDDTNVLLRTPRQHNMYSIDLNNIVPHKNLTCLVAKASVDKIVTDDFSRFTWTFFLRTKDETSSILKSFITEIENLKDLKVKLIRCDNGGEFKNQEMNEFCTRKGTSSTNISGTKDVASQAVKKDVSSLRYTALPNCGISNPTATSKVSSADQVELAVSLIVESDILTVSSPVPTVFLDISPKSSSGPRLISKRVFSQKEAPSLGNALTLSNRFEDTFGDTTNAITLHEVEADLSNMETSIPVSPTPTFRIQIIGPVDNPVQTRHKSKDMEEQSFIATIHQKTNPELLQFCLFLCFLSQEEPKKIFDALKDPSWVEDMQEELLQLKIQNVWVLVDCPKGMDVKSAFLYGTIDEEVYVMQPPGFQDPEFPDRLYKVEKAMYRLHQASRAWYGQLILSWTKRILEEKIDLTIVATSITKAEYVAAASGCRQVLWIQNQMLDYG